MVEYQRSGERPHRIAPGAISPSNHPHRQHPARSMESMMLVDPAVPLPLSEVSPRNTEEPVDLAGLAAKVQYLPGSAVVVVVHLQAAHPHNRDN